jgi:cobalt-zinc-cadmium efflux system outer membrane protein
MTSVDPKSRALATASWGGRWLVLALLASTAPGCRAICNCTPQDQVASQIEQSTGYDLGPGNCCGELVLPNGANLDDGLAEDEAVLIALWNNAAFRALLVDLDLAHADLVAAGLLPNPEFVYYWPVSDKPFKYLLDFPLESLWLRPIRVASAAREQDRTASRLAQAGLDLIRDVRLAYANVLLAQGRLQVAEEAVKLREKIARLAQARLDAGDAGPQEVAAVTIDALVAQQDVARIRLDVTLAEDQLRNLLAIGRLERKPLELESPRTPVQIELELESLTTDALETRPDMAAAAEATDAAAARVKLARVGWFRLLGILDATSGRTTGHDFGPALRMTLPVFNRNEGAVARAESELERAYRQQQTVHDQIVLDVALAADRVAQAQAEWQVLETRVRPQAERAIRQAEAGYREGDSPYVIVLQTTQQLLNTHLRRVQLQADLRRSWAELERSVGRRLDAAEELPETAGEKNP